MPTDLNSLLEILKNDKTDAKRLVIIGEQLQWPQKYHLEENRNCSQKTSRSNIESHLGEAKKLIQQLDQFVESEFLFVSAESRYDHKHLL